MSNLQWKKHKDLTGSGVLPGDLNHCVYGSTLTHMSLWNYERLKIVDLLILPVTVTFVFPSSQWVGTSPSQRMEFQFGVLSLFGNLVK